MRMLLELVVSILFLSSKTSAVASQKEEDECNKFASAPVQCEEVEPLGTWEDIKSLQECVNANFELLGQEPNSANDQSGPGPNKPCGCTYHVFSTVDFWGVEGADQNACDPDLPCTNFGRGPGEIGCFCRRVVPLQNENCKEVCSTFDTECHLASVSLCSQQLLEDLSIGGCRRSGSDNNCVLSEDDINDCAMYFQFGDVEEKLVTDSTLRSTTYQALEKYREVHTAVFTPSRTRLSLWPKTCSGYNYNGEKWESDLMWKCVGCGCDNILDKTLSVRGESIVAYNGVCFDASTKTASLAVSENQCETDNNKEFRSFGTPANYIGTSVHRFFMSVQQAFFDYVLNPEMINANPTWPSLYGNGWDKEAEYWPMTINEKKSVVMQALENVSANVDITLDYSWGRPVAYAEHPKLVPLGLYLPPGVLGTLTTPISTAGTGIENNVKIVIGAHRNDPSDRGKGKFRNERPGGIFRRLDRITHEVSLPEAGESVNLFNPLGGNLYIAVQRAGVNVGLTTLDFTNVIVSPFFSRTQSLNTTCDRIPTGMGSSVLAPWLDMMTDESLLQVPTSVIQSWSCDEMEALAGRWQERFRDLAMLFGHREIRNRYVLHSQIDLTSLSGGGGIGEPMVNRGFERYNTPIVEDHNWRLTDLMDVTDMHELGHMQAIPNFPGEGESNVHLPYTYTGLKTGRTLEETFRESTEWNGDMKNAVIDWVVTNEFAAGKPMNIENNEDNQVRYQARGHAHYVYIASVYGWEPLMAYFHAHNLFYEAFKIHYSGEDSTLPFESQKEKFYTEKWPWKDILGKVAEASTLEEVEWNAIESFFDGSWSNASYMSTTGVGIVLMSLATRTNLLPHFEFWGMNGITDGTTKDDINELVGDLPMNSNGHQCRLFELYESYLPQNQKDLTDHIFKIYPDSIQSIQNNIITWKQETYYLSNRYGPGWYILNDTYDSEKMQMSYARIMEGKNVVCTSVPTPKPSTSIIPAPTVPTGQPTDNPSTTPTNGSETCEDSVNSFIVKIKGKNRWKNCNWASKKSPKYRCNLSRDVKTTCPDTCQSCSPCADSTARLRFKHKGKRVLRYCNWVGKKQTGKRCKMKGLAEACRDTCGLCDNEDEVEVVDNNIFH